MTEHLPSGHVPLWRAVIAAIRGTDEDFTSGKLGRDILLLAIPMVLEMSMQAVFEVVDTFFVGRLGPDAVAVVGLTGALLTIVFAVCAGLGMATTAMVARRVGERDLEGAGTAAAQSIFLGIAIALPISLFGCFFAVFQRRRRHPDSHLDQFHRLLADPDSGRLCPGDPGGTGRRGRLHRHHHRAGLPGRHRGPDLSPGTLEDAANLGKCEVRSAKVWSLEFGVALPESSGFPDWGLGEKRVGARPSS